MTLFSEYIADLKAEKNISQATVKAKRSHLGMFEEWCGHLPISKITPQLVRDYLIYKRQLNQPASVETCARHLHGFFNWCVAKGRLGASPMEGMRVDHAPPKPRRVFPVAELRQRLLAVCQTERERLIVDVLSRIGVRVGEMAALKWEDIDDDFCFATITGKTGHRRIPLNTEVRAILASHRNGCRHVIPSERRPCEGISADRLAEIIGRLAKRAGLPITSHSFRASVITNLCRKTSNLRAISGIFHKNPQTTLIYMDNSEETKLETIELLD